MAIIPYSLARKALFALDAEAAHDVVIKSLSLTHSTPLAQLYQEQTVSDPIQLAGLQFKNRIGLAAGLDKNGRAIDGLAGFGFGSIEVGTVTPLPQPGNPKPRIFRLPEANALINRMGFNNLGIGACIENIKRSSFQKNGGILGINIGKNAFTPIASAADDYLIGLRQAYAFADYVTINISSPNTQNLRELQKDDALDALLAALGREREILAQASGKRVPLFVKIAPDLDAAQIELIARSLQSHFMDGVIATNTTLARDAVKNLPHASETGGLSGAPVFEASNKIISQLRKALGAGYPIIGVGGVMSGQDAVAKIKAGADLVQVYTGLIYKGGELVKECAQAMKAAR